MAAKWGDPEDEPVGVEHRPADGPENNIEFTNFNMQKLLYDWMSSLANVAFNKTQSHEIAMDLR